MGTVAVATLALVLAAVGPAVAGPDDDPVPSEADVASAEAAVQTKASDVESVQAQLAAAEERLQRTEILAIQATEVFNAARHRAQQASEAARAAQQASDEASRALGIQREAYADAVNTSYQLGPSLSPLAALSNADGVSGVLQNTTLLEQAAAAIDDTYQTYDAVAVQAESADVRAEEAEAAAAATQTEARTARDEAEAAADDAVAQTAAYAAARDGLIAELAELQDISVGLARQRQEALEQAAAEAAAQAAAEAAAQAAAEAAAQAAAEVAAQAAAEAAAQEAAEQAAQEAAEEAEQNQPTPDPTQPPTPTPTPTPPPVPEDPPDPTPPAPSGGAGAAIAFARAQIGEPYHYGASGPNSWDCSGLTMKAWQQGGKSLPHSSAMQYSVSTPISIGNLQPGDLLFWGSSPGSIYHVALYVGDGMMIHAPRTGRDVEEVSMYYWITPNFFARA